VGEEGEVKRYRYRIQVGDQYTYRDSIYTLDRLVQDLLDEGINYEGDLAEASRLLRKAKGESVPEPPNLSRSRRKRSQSRWKRSRRRRCPGRKNGTRSELGSFHGMGFCRCRDLRDVVVNPSSDTS
jgi:hypothetical protein